MDRRAMRTAFSWDFAKRSLIVAAVVGTLLTLINQGRAVFGAADFQLWAALLTYCTPFFVSSYGVYASLARDADVDARTPPCKSGKSS